MVLFTKPPQERDPEKMKEVVRAIDSFVQTVLQGMAAAAAMALKVIGSALAFSLLGVPEEQALLMILFNWMMSIILVVGIGLVVLWQSGIDIRNARIEAERADVRG